MEALPTGPRGRVLATALLLGALTAAYFCVAAPLLEVYAAHESLLEDRQVLASRLAAAAQRMPALRERVSVLRARASESRLGLDGASDAIAAADLQSRVEELATSIGAGIDSSEGLPPETRDAFRRIGIRLAITGPYETLVNFFAALETAPPPLVVDNVRITGGLTRASAAGPVPLSASLEIYGFREGAGSETADPRGSAAMKGAP